MSRAVATLLLLLVLAPVAQAAAATAARSTHSCCPKQDRPPADAHCQFAAPLVCCAQSGAAASSAKETAPPAQLSIAHDSPAAAAVLPARCGAVLRTESPPSIRPLLRSTVLQL